MTAYTFDFTRRALTDLDRIRDGIAARSPQGARAVIADLFAAMHHLRDTPHRGVVGGQPAAGGDPVRSLAVGSYVVYFRAVDRTRTVRVLRVRHGARRPLRRFS